MIEKSPKWKVGDTVRTNLDHAWLYDGTEFQNLMGRDRRGVVVEVPWSLAYTGRGTVRVKRESLTGTPIKNPTCWVHTDLVLRSQ